MLRKLKDRKLIDKENKKYEYEGLQLWYCISDLYYNENIHNDIIDLIMWGERTTFSMGFGRKDVLCCKVIKIQIENNKWRQILKSGKKTKFKKIKELM